MSRPSVMRFGSQQDLDHTQNTIAAQASLPEISLFKFRPTYIPTTTTLSRSQTNFTSLMKPQLSWNTLKKMFTNGGKRDEEVKHIPQQMEDQQPWTPSLSDTEATSQEMGTSQESTSSQEISTPVNTPPTSPKGKAPLISRQTTQIVFHPQTLSETAEELTSLGIKVKDYGYPSTTTPAPYCNTPAPFHDLPAITCQFSDPSLALAEVRYRISTNSPLSVRGQKARWLLDMGWLTEKDSRTFRPCDWEAVNAYDAKPESEKPRFWYTSRWRIPPNANERYMNDQKWALACFNIEKHEISLTRKKRHREQDANDAREEPEKKKLKKKQSADTPLSVSPAKPTPKPTLKRRRKVPLPPISEKQYPCPIECYDPTEYDPEEIRQSQETMRKRDEAEANEGDDVWEIIEEVPSPSRQTPPPVATPPQPPTPELPTRTMPPPLNPSGTKRKLGLRRTETLLQF